MTPQEKEIWQQRVFGEEPTGDIGAKVRQANPEPTRAETKGTTSGGNPARDTAILKQVQAEHPEWTLSQQLQEAAKRTKAPTPPPPPPRPIARNLPPEAALRFILEAKNGEISPGELARRYAKYGLSSAVRPLDQG